MSNPLETFNADRDAGQARLMACEHQGVKRLLTLDHQAYLDRTDQGGLDERTKELLGLVASAVLRCDDCITYHLQQCAKLGLTKPQVEDALNVALIVGGSIVIPHMRRGLLLFDQMVDSDSA
jgi:AhpD family alkylhydroperoxidase